MGLHVYVNIFILMLFVSAVHNLLFIVFSVFAVVQILIIKTATIYNGNFERTITSSPSIICALYMLMTPMHEGNQNIVIDMYQQYCRSVPFNRLDLRLKTADLPTLEIFFSLLI